MNSRNNQTNISILKSLNDRELKELVNLIKIENSVSILASLDSRTIKEYLLKIIDTSEIMILVARKKKNIIAYAIVTKKINKLITIFSFLKYKILFNMIINFKFIRLLNIFLSFTKLDIFFLSKKQKKIINSNYNLNLIAVKKNFQSKGLGSVILKKIFKLSKKSKFITVESIDDRAYEFYIKKHKFTYLNQKLRFPKNLKVLYRKTI